MKRNLILFIKDILENIELIEDSTKDLSKEQFESSKDIIDATIRRIEIIGEAVKNIPDPFREKYPKIPWKDIAGMRDVVIHGYFRVDLDTVWNVVKNDLLKLKKDVREILEKEKIESGRKID